MAEEKKVAAEEVAAPAEEKPAKKKTTKKAEKAPKVEEKKFAKPTEHDFSVIVTPHITEKSMALMQNANKVTVKVNAKSNKVEIKNAFQRIFQVKVVDVKTVNQVAKSTTRGGRYRGTISGYKKAIVTIEAGAALDLFKE